ncbi:alkene reductase [Palleronia sp. LCG004]|uniref:alkene reductase n=1 Tax=Palleronia sp. LCG004 TaxID=3079304 RepID=UPI0029438842|nr:alkene reductase [Palleronia sp. LCG004]WOI57187.1 alkene reductase [Palleronia sp. LCG004]
MADRAKLFAPATMGAIELPNRVLMAPLTRNRAQSDGTPSDLAQTYYGQRAGAGLIISEATQVDAMGKGYLDTPGIHSDAHVAAWHLITDAVHAKGGRIFLQLWHVGRISHVSLLPDGRSPLAPSAIQADTQTFTANGFENCSPPEAMSLDQIHETIEQFRNGAELARKAGFDGVEIHSANGYLLDQFIQDKTNQRDDEYGGPVENRIRIVSEIVDAVATQWSRDRIGIRVSPLGHANDIGDSDVEGTFGALYEMLSDKRLAYLHVMEQFPGHDNEGEAAALVRRLRGRYDGFVISNGGYTADTAVDAIASGHADAVAFGRDFIATPDLPERFRVDADLNEQDQDTFYGGGAEGYTDYPFMAEDKTLAS